MQTTSLNVQNQTGATIVVILGGTPIPLPVTNYNSGYTVAGGGASVTINTAGSYFITYEIGLTAAIAVQAAVFSGGSALASTVTNPGLLTVTTLTKTSIVNLGAGAVLTLQLFGLAATAVLQSGAGASLTIIRIQ